MSISIPKDLRSLAFPELTLVDLNDVDVDRLLPHLWELIVRQGRTVPSKTDADAYDAYLTKLAEDPRLEGFDNERGRQVLDGWLRSSVVRIGAKGRGRVKSKMDYVLPLTLASYRAGLPKFRSRHRRAEELVYRLLVGALEERNVESPAKNLRKLLEDAVGHGVRIGPDGSWTAEYDGTPEIDINALLSLYFLEQFAVATGRGPTRRLGASPVPGATGRFAADLLDFITAYGGYLPPAAFIDRLAALISLHLFQLPLRIATSSRHLLRTGDPTADMMGHGSNPLELYCDFTRVPGSASDELARQCVQRDLDVMRGFLPDRLVLKTLYEALDVLDEEGQQIKSLPLPETLLAMVGQQRHPMVAAHVMHQMRSIENETKASGDEDGLAEIAAIRRSGLLPVEQLTSILASELGEQGMTNQVSWFSSTGGIQKNYGVLAGTRAARRSWRYAPSDDLLSALLLVCFTTAHGARWRREMPIAELLNALRERFGILVDRPPTMFDSADNRAASAANFDAFKRRLQLLGCFNSLSDDFSAQFVTNPLESA